MLITKEPMQPDSYSYDTIGWNLAQGHGYVNAWDEITMEREPLYPFFLAVIYFLFGHNHFPAQISQITLFLLTVILVYRIARVVFNKETALYSMAIVAFFPTLINYPSYIVSETLFTFLTSLLVFSCIKIYFTNKWVYYILTGLILGMSALCKAVMLPFIFIIIFWLLLLRSKTAKGVLIKIIVLMSIFCCVITPWMYRNYTNFGSFSLRAGSEVPLCIKVLKLEYSLEDFKKAFIFTISENLGKKMFPGAVENPGDFLFKEDALVREKILPGLKEKGYSSKEIKSKMTAEMMKRPFKSLAVSSLDLLKMTQFTYIPILIDQEYIIKKITGFPCGIFLLSLLRGVFRLLAYLLILFSIWTMWIKRSEWKNWIFLVLLICYTNLIYILIYGHGRYGVPLIPYYVILATPVIIAIKNKGIKKCQK
jgi:4-amino-4-deoxy-L-arabinose transferase-like glycosyltransferase